MKKLTWLLMSLMLFLGMGTAFAITPPTFTPASGSVTPGQAIQTTLYEGGSYVVLIWTFDDRDAIETAMAELQFPGDMDAIQSGIPGINMSMCMGVSVGAEGDVEGVVIETWQPSGVEVPGDAQGEITLKARLAIGNDNGFESTGVIKVNYTAAGEVKTIPLPTFNPAQGPVKAGSKVSLSVESSGNPYKEHLIAYVINNENIDFTQYTGDQYDPETKLPTNMAYPRTGSTPIVINDAKTVTAASYIYDWSTESIIGWSEKVTVHYTIAAEEVLPVPVFNPNGGEVEKGTSFTLTNGTESDATPKKIYYNHGSKKPSDLTNIKTEAELKAASRNGLTSQNAANEYKKALVVNSAQTYNAATASFDADGNITWSEVVTASFTIKVVEPTKPAAPEFTPDGGEVEAEEEITITSTCSSCKIYYARGTNPSFVNIDNEEELEEEMNGLSASFSEYGNSNKPTLGNYGVETPGAKLSISAAVASIDASGNILWSDVTTKEFTVKSEEGPVDPVETVAAPVISPANDASVHMGDMVTITCATEDAEIWYTANGKLPYTEDNKGNINGISSDAVRYTEPFALTEDMLVKQGKAYSLRIRAVTKKGNAYANTGVGLNAYPNAPQFSPVAGVVEKGTKVTITCEPSQAVIYYTTDGTTPSEEESTPYTEPIEITEAMTLKAVAVLGQYQTSASAVYKIEGEAEAVTLTFNPESGSEVEENTAVTITASDADVDIFYMMFESEEAAKAAEWDQEQAELYSNEMQPVLSAEKTTVKAAYAYVGAEAVAETFFYATYTVKAQPAIELTFNPASGSKVKEGTEITVTASRQTEIFYKLYADKVAADADEAFTTTAKEVTEDGMPVITKENTFLRCGVFDKGAMQYFDAEYTINTANEDEELAGVTVYPNPSNGVFNLELPVAATVEVFMSNGVLYQRLSLSEGNTTLNINRSGIYFLRITGEGRTAIKRIIVR